jgi:mannose-6-phosphate isomerase-like protein (cupin superfamily)
MLFMGQSFSWLVMAPRLPPSQPSVRNAKLSAGGLVGRDIRSGLLESDGHPDRRTLRRVRAAPAQGVRGAAYSHQNEDEIFLVLEGEVRLQLGDKIVEDAAGSLLYTPLSIGHSFHVDSVEARILLLFGPAGVEGFFRDVATSARALSHPLEDERVLDPDKLGRNHESPQE